MSEQNIKEQKFLHVLHEVYGLLEDENIEAWLDAGALLKHTRGQSMYPSSDIDFGIKAEDRFKLTKIERLLEERGYITGAIGELPFFFEGLYAKKALGLGNQISVDIYVYYHFDNWYVRPNFHKPIKQNKIYMLMFIFLFKAGCAYQHLKESKNIYLEKTSKFVFDCLAKLYFSVVQTTQFGIPDKFFLSIGKTEVAGKDINTPQNVQKYLKWRYGPNWRKQNKNWRLTDGDMMFLGKLSAYKSLFMESPQAISSQSNKLNTGGSGVLEKQKGNKSHEKKRNTLFEFTETEFAELKKTRSKFAKLNLFKKVSK